MIVVPFGDDLFYLNRLFSPLNLEGKVEMLEVWTLQTHTIPSECLETVAPPQKGHTRGQKKTATSSNIPKHVTGGGKRSTCEALEDAPGADVLAKKGKLDIEARWVGTPTAQEGDSF